MDVIYPRCCGLDVHKREVVACVVSTDADGTPRKAIRAFGTMTPDILALADWLAAHEVSHVAWRAPGSTGSRSGTCWRTVSSSSWSMRGM